ARRGGGQDRLCRRTARGRFPSARLWACGALCAPRRHVAHVRLLAQPAHEEARGGARMTAWETVTWNVARAGGLTAYALLACSVVVGLALTLHWQSPRWPRLINSEWHNYLTLLSLVFVSVHVLAVWVDPFTHFGLNEMWIPLASHYRPP